MALTTVSNNALSNITAIPASIPTGSLTLIKSITASASASISFVDGTDGVVLDGTYSSYVFKFINIHPSLDSSLFEFQGSTNGGSTYGVTITSTDFLAYNHESNGATGLNYVTSFDLAQSTAYQILAESGNDNDQNASGFLQLFAPNSGTFVKHFISRTSMTQKNDYMQDNFMAGYFNTISAIDAVQFKMSSGNIDDGIIKLYGVK